MNVRTTRVRTEIVLPFFDIEMHLYREKTQEQQHLKTQNNGDMYVTCMYILFYSSPS